jgi:hypothetical protein
LQRLTSDRRFQYVLDKYPSLKPTLRRIYHATLHPLDLLDAGLEMEGEDDESLAKKWGGPDMRKWTQKAADERALAMMMELKSRDEGVAEFLELLKDTMMVKDGEEQ